jgi:hypothetical protein
MNQVVPPTLFQSLAWAGFAAFIAVALIEWRSGSLYHTVLALGLAGLIAVTSRGPRPTWAAVLLLVLLLVFGIYRALIGYALLRGA